MDEPKLGAWSALPAYVALLLGMFFIGVPAQIHDVVPGLWVTEAVAIALPAVFVLCLAGVRFGPYLGFRKLSWKHAIVTVVAAAANQPIVSLLTWGERTLLPQKIVDGFDAQQRMLGGLFAGEAKWLMVGTVVIAAPLGEELFFRGYLLPSLRKSWGLLAAVLVSGALFSALHADLVGFLGLMEIGVLLAALRLWSGSIWAAMLGHAVNNGIAGGAFLLGVQDPDEPTPIWALALGVPLLIGFAVLLVKVLRRGLPEVEERGRPRIAVAVVLAALWIVAFCAGAWSMRGR